MQRSIPKTKDIEECKYIHCSVCGWLNKTVRTGSVCDGVTLTKIYTGVCWLCNEEINGEVVLK